jgi:hypothetical protein
MIRAIVIAVVLVGSTAAADVDGAETEVATVLPGAESGRVDGGDHDSTLRVFVRGVLFVPRVLTQLVFAPVRAGVWAFERYQVEARLMELLFDDAEVVGLYPIAQLDSGFGLNAGGRLVHRDVFGAREHLALQASTGGRYRQRYKASFRTGDRLGERVAVAVVGELDRRPKDPYYGVGNLDDAPEARHRQELTRGTAVVDVRAIGNLHVRTSAAVVDLGYGQSDTGPAIDMLYGVDTLTGWGGVRELYGELELRWDDRRRARRWEPEAVRATGWLASAFVGRVHSLEMGRDYARYGFDAQRFLRLGEGPRVLVARLYGEAVTGTLDEVPFTQLPQLGGKVLLRGYPTDRFRDRVAALGSLEYRWDLSFRLTGSLFVDAGRVYRSVRDLGVEDLRVGYGIGIEYHSHDSFVGQLSLASSIDGGVFVNVAFDPVFDLDPRVERR